MRFAGKVAVITGAAQGIGRSSAERFLSEGAKVGIADIDESRLMATAVEIGAPETVLPVVTDAAKKADVGRLIAATVHRFGRIDILLNNAGSCPVADILDFTEEQYDQTLAVNLGGHSSAPRRRAAR